MKTTQIKAEYVGTKNMPSDHEKYVGQSHIFHFTEVGNNIVLFPCYDGEVLRYETIHEFLEEWRLVEKL